MVPAFTMLPRPMIMYLEDSSRMSVCRESNWNSDIYSCRVFCQHNLKDRKNVEMTESTLTEGDTASEQQSTIKRT
jgi:hypothetical protein